MILTCPHCETHYRIAEDQLPPGGRQVKCASCHTQWVASTEEEVFVYYGATGTDGVEFMSPIRPSSIGQRKAEISLPEADTPEKIRQEALQALYDGANANPQPRRARDFENNLRHAFLGEGFAHLKRKKIFGGGPFHQKLETIEADTHNTDGAERRIASQPVPPTTQQLVIAEPSAEKHNTRQNNEENAPSLQEAGEAFRVLSRLVAQTFVTLGRHLAEFIDTHIPKGLFQYQPQPEKIISPGDKTASEFRQFIRRKERNRLTPLRLVGWAGWLSVCVGLIIGLLISKENVMSIWPATEKLYALMGATAEEDPIEISNFAHRYAMSNKGPVIEMRGTLFHTGDEQIPTPLLEATAYDANNAMLASWVFEIPGASLLQPQMELPFLTRTLAPEGIVRLEIDTLPADQRKELTDPAIDAETIAPIIGEDHYLQKTDSGWTSGR
ncbi:MAG: zinc-ribbon domain-containing protein [bacterium]